MVIVLLDGSWISKNLTPGGRVIIVSLILDVI